MSDVLRNDQNSYFQKQNHLALRKTEVTKTVILDAAVQRAAGRGRSIRALGAGFTNLFANSEQGVIYDPSDISSLSQDVAGATPVTAAGQPVGRILDLSGNGNHATQATASKRPTYQTDGVLHWLQFDGVDDAMATPSIDFTATDEMSVFVGLRKLSGTAAMLLETSINSGANSGTFSFVTPDSATDRYRYFSRGTLNGFANVTSALYNAPVTSVLTGFSKIATPVSTIRVDGAQFATTAASQGTGNYTAQVLYLGARASTSLYFTGNLYGLTIRNALSDAGDIFNAELLMAELTGLTL
tara:strand:+ start:1143 stop:2039 length:897 start_codon:yes stop_codon:yes gene_type:complete